MKEHTLNHIRAPLVEGIFLNYGILESLGSGPYWPLAVTWLPGVSQKRFSDLGLSANIDKQLRFRVQGLGFRV